MMMTSTDLFTLTLILSCIKTNASVISTRTDDLISVNEHLYDPDLYGSLYQETSRKKRLYLAPGLSNLEKALDNGSFDIDVLNETPKDIRDKSAGDIPNIGKSVDLFNLDTETDENAFQPDKELSLTSEKNRKVMQKLNAKLRNYNLRSRRWPTKRRAWSKIIGRQGKRYRAGVADRLAHGFGKRSAIKTIDFGDVERIAENDSDFQGGPINKEKPIKELAKLISGLTAERREGNGLDSLVYIRNPESKSLVDLIKEVLRANGAVTDSGRIKEDIILRH